MARKLGIALLALALVIGMAVAYAANQPEGKITISASGKKDAVFDHSAHVARDDNCQTCHHKDASGSEQKCTNCHTAEGKDDAPNAKTAFHKQCGDCHKKHPEAPQYPRGCKVCHPPK